MSNTVLLFITPEDRAFSAEVIPDNPELTNENIAHAVSQILFCESVERGERLWRRGRY